MHEFSNNQKLIQTLLSQIEERNKVIKSLTANISRNKELHTIRTKEKDKKHKNTVLVLTILLLLSLIANILFLIY